MKIRGVRNAVAALILAIGLLGMTPAGQCQGTTQIIKDPKTGNIQLKALTSKDLKAAIAHAVTNGDMDAHDGQQLIDKITDIETLMDQFDFIRDQQRRLIGSYGSLIH